MNLLYKIEDYYANNDEFAIYNAFKKKVSVHPMLSGHAISENEHLSTWNTIINTPSYSKRRSLYIHIPFCLKRCSFCSFFNCRTDEEEINQYAQYLLKELAFVLDTNFLHSVPIHAVYFGGGTPTDLSTKNMHDILSFIKSNYPLANDCEITMEGRIRDLTDEKIETCIKGGVNRFSLGVQSFNTWIRQSLGRIDDEITVLSTLKKISDTKQAITTVDLIYGLPNQEIDDWINDLKIVRDSDFIDSCSLYQLNVMKNTPIQRDYDKGKYPDLIDSKRVADFFLASNEFMRNSNARRLSLRHWAFSSRDRSLYNINSKYSFDCLAFGSRAGGVYHDYRIMQDINIKEYYRKIDSGFKAIAFMEKKTPSYRITDYIVGSLEEHCAIDFKQISKMYSIENLIDIFKPLLVQWESVGLINIKNDRLVLTDAGEYWNVNIAQYLIEYFKSNYKGE